MTEYAQRTGQRGLSQIEITEQKHLAYGPKEQLKLWKILYESDKMKEKEK